MIQPNPKQVTEAFPKQIRSSLKMQKKDNFDLHNFEKLSIAIKPNPSFFESS